MCEVNKINMWYNNIIYHFHFYLEKEQRLKYIKVRTLYLILITHDFLSQT